jgi:hypothetical protein
LADIDVACFGILSLSSKMSSSQRANGAALLKIMLLPAGISVMTVVCARHVRSELCGGRKNSIQVQLIKNNSAAPPQQTQCVLRVCTAPKTLR